MGLGLGTEELALHEALCQCEASLRQLADPGDAFAGSKAHAHIHDKRVQEKLATLRSKIRDLELCAEEADK